MCQTIPIQIKSIKGINGILADGRKVNLALLQKPKKGDWVLANADLAVNKVSAKEAKEILKLFKINK